MNSPNEFQPQAEFFEIAIERLFPSPTQPRKRFDEAKLNDLAESIRMQGVLQPILVRKGIKPNTKASWPFPTPKLNTLLNDDKKHFDQHFEIIAGERRYRAAKLAGLANIPCFIRELTDLQVLHAQVIENLQRDDLHPIEEAEGYEKLMQQKDAEGKPYSADTIAGEVGKSRTYVYGRLKLLALCNKAREVFFDGKIDASTALLIARISPEKIQLDALNDIIKREMSYRHAFNHIQQNYMLELKEAIFDTKDAALVKKVGACTDCPKRTGNQPDLFSDVKSKDVCTDPVCFDMKKAAHFLIVRNKAEAEGATIIKGAEAKKLIPYNHISDYSLQEKGYALPTGHIPNDPKNHTWEQALKKAKLLDSKEGAKPVVQPTLIEHPHEKGEIVQVFNIEQAAKALREAGYEINLRGTTGTRHTKTDKEKQEEAKLRIQTKVENLYRDRLSTAIREQAERDLLGDTPQLRPEVFRLLARTIFSDSKAYSAKSQMVEAHLGEAVAKKDSWQKNDAFMAHIGKLSPQQCMLIMIELIKAPECQVDSWQVRQKYQPDTMLALAGIHGIDATGIKAQAKQEIEQATAAKKPTKKPVMES